MSRFVASRFRPSQSVVAAAADQAAAGEFGTLAGSSPMVAHVDEQLGTVTIDGLDDLAFVGVQTDVAAELPSLAVIVAEDDVRCAGTAAVGSLAMIGWQNEPAAVRAAASVMPTPGPIAYQPQPGFEAESVMSRTLDQVTPSSSL